MYEQRYLNVLPYQLMKLHFFVFLCFSILLFLLNGCVKEVEKIVEVPSKNIPTDSAGCSSNNDISICYTKTQPCAPSVEEFTFTCSGSAIDNAVSFEWYFGDGFNKNTTSKKVTHTYKDLNWYSVLLKAKQKDNSYVEKYIAVFACGLNVTPIASYEWYSDNIVGNTATYLFQSTQYGGAGSCDYNWDFGDSTTGQGKKTYHTFKLKTYEQQINVTLSEVSQAGCASSKVKQIILPAAFNITDTISYTKTSACLSGGEEFTFTAPTKNVPASALYIWDFGDGINGVIGNPVYKKYTHNNSYQPTVSIWYNGREIYKSGISVYALGQSAKPQAVFTTQKSYENATEVGYNFNNAQSAAGGFSLSNWLWDFGDGSSPVNNNQQNPNKVYQKKLTEQTYTVSMTVTSSSGCSSTTSTTVVIPKI